MKGPSRYQREKKADAQARAAQRIRRAEIKRKAMEAAEATYWARRDWLSDEDPPPPAPRRTPPKP